MWTMLKLLPGLDLPDFLMGSRFAYGSVTRLMYTQDWESLEPLVSEQMLKAMQETMEEITGGGRRVIEVETADAITVEKAVLRQVLIMSDDSESSVRRCHLDVHIVSHEKWQLMDYHTNKTVEPYDGRVRVQESTWRFEGVIAPPPADGEESSDAAATDTSRQVELGWTVYAIV